MTRPHLGLQIAALAAILALNLGRIGQQSGQIARKLTVGFAAQAQPDLAWSLDQTRRRVEAAAGVHRIEPASSATG